MLTDNFKKWTFIEPKNVWFQSPIFLNVTFLKKKKIVYMSGILED